MIPRFDPTIHLLEAADGIIHTLDDQSLVDKIHLDMGMAVLALDEASRYGTTCCMSSENTQTAARALLPAVLLTHIYCPSHRVALSSGRYP